MRGKQTTQVMFKTDIRTIIASVNSREYFYAQFKIWQTSRWIFIYFPIFTWLKQRGK